MRQKANVDELAFALTADVTEAHRQVPIHPDDWHYLPCQVVPGGDAFVNTVGTSGVASASYYWSRVAAAVAGYTSTSWHMLVVDDHLLECGGPEYRCGQLFFYVFAPRLVCLCPGTRLAGATLLFGSVSSSCCG